MLVSFLATVAAARSLLPFCRGEVAQVGGDRPELPQLTSYGVSIK
jgi:hypothetical protein